MTAINWTLPDAIDRAQNLAANVPVIVLAAVFLAILVQHFDRNKLMDIHINRFDRIFHRLTDEGPAIFTVGIIISQFAFGNLDFCRVKFHWIGQGYIIKAIIN